MHGSTRPTVDCINKTEIEVRTNVLANANHTINLPFRYIIMKPDVYTYVI